MYQKMLSWTGTGLAPFIAGATMLFATQTVQAGPVFQILSTGSTAPFALSGSWGFASTGGGGMVGSITLHDSFVLPTATSGNAIFSETDIVEVSYSHVQTPFSSGIVTPLFSFTADQSELSSASGEIQFTGPDSFQIPSFNLNIETTVAGALFVPLGGSSGIVEGDFFINGITAGIHGSTSPVDFDVSLVANSTASGDWVFTGFSDASNAIPEPGTMATLGIGLAGLVIMRRRKRP